jgi:hypothetical protein
MWVYGCPQFDESTMNCDGAQWVEIPEQPTLFPQLSVEDGLQISFAIASVWTIGFIARLIRNAVVSR